jgi:hypothetical protein
MCGAASMRPRGAAMSERVRWLRLWLAAVVLGVALYVGGLAERLWRAAR